MPRKHQQRSLLTKPTPSGPPNLSLSSAASANQSERSHRTVNELIHESRHVQGVTARMHTGQSPSPVPPTLREVLDIPSPTPPPPRPGIRGPSRLRRIPGPPPPPSWLSGSRYASRKLKDDGRVPLATRWRSTRDISILPGPTMPAAQSLQHLLLKSMASNWKWHVEYDHTYLAELPTGLKEILLSYIAIYNEENGPSPMRILFPHNDDCQDELDQITRLDLGNAIGVWTTVKRLERELVTTREKVFISSLDAVPEAWDEQDGADTKDMLQSTGLTTYLRFQNLKHLSLATGAVTSSTKASWQDLLSLVSKIPTITSLSLAYWPQPTYTPNASKGRYKIQVSDHGSSPNVIYGGSDFYTAFDNNWREAAGILRTLSRSLYCLKWLDLTGCGEWFPALTWQPNDEDTEDAHGPDWNGSWRSLEHLVLAVGWKPAVSQNHTINPTLSTDGMPARFPQNLSPSAAAHGTLTSSWDVEQERDKYHHRKEVEQYMQLSNCAKKVAQDLRVLRKESGKGWIHVDFGPEDDMF